MKANPSSTPSLTQNTVVHTWSRSLTWRRFSPLASENRPGSDVLRCRLRPEPHPQGCFFLWFSYTSITYPSAGPDGSILPYHVVSCHAMSYHVIAHRVMSCHVCHSTSYAYVYYVCQAISHHVNFRIVSCTTSYRQLGSTGPS